jgi:hypothetical protein
VADSASPFTVLSASAPVVEAVVVEAPVVEPTVVEAPVVETPVVPSAVVPTTVVEAPVVEAAVMEAPVVEPTVVEAAVMPMPHVPMTSPPVIGYGRGTREHAHGLLERRGRGRSRRGPSGHDVGFGNVGSAYEQGAGSCNGHQASGGA